MTDEPDDDNDSGATRNNRDPAQMPDFPDGPKGILTDSDRTYLLSTDSEFPGVTWEGDETQKRWRIRRRVQNALYDFQLLSELDASELDLIFNDVLDDEMDSSLWQNYTVDDLTAESKLEMRRFGWGDQFEYLLSMMVFAHRACDVSPLLTFEHLVEEAVRRRAPRYRGNAPFGQGQRATSINVDVDIDVDIEWEDILIAEEIEEKLESGDTISREEVGQLFLEGRIEPGDLGADDVDPHLFRKTGGRDSSKRELPGLEPSKPSPEAGWDADLQERLPTDMVEVVDWDEAEQPADVWQQLEEHYDDPVGNVIDESDNLNPN